MVASNLKKYVKKDTLVMSIAAGVKLETLADALGDGIKIARVMPNTLGISKHGYSAICFNKNVQTSEKAEVETVVSALGQAMYINENMYDAFTGFSCTGPLWIYKMVDAMVAAGVYEGFTRKDAINIVLENMMGVAQILQTTGEEASSRVIAMSSPGGVTVEGLKYLNSEGFDAVVMKSINKAVNKAKSV